MVFTDRTEIKLPHVGHQLVTIFVEQFSRAVTVRKLLNSVALAAQIGNHVSVVSGQGQRAILDAVLIVVPL